MADACSEELVKALASPAKRKSFTDVADIKGYAARTTAEGAKPLIQISQKMRPWISDRRPLPLIFLPSA
jgi:hypothetical protein